MLRWEGESWGKGERERGKKKIWNKLRWRNEARDRRRERDTFHPVVTNFAIRMRDTHFFKSSQRLPFLLPTSQSPYSHHLPRSRWLKMLISIKKKNFLEQKETLLLPFLVSFPIRLSILNNFFDKRNCTLSLCRIAQHRDSQSESSDAPSG